MSQNTIDKEFATQKILSSVKKFRLKIDEILSRTDNVSFEGIFALKTNIENIIRLLFDSVLEGEYILNTNIIEDLNSVKKELYSSEELEKQINDISFFEEQKSFLSETRKLLYLTEEIIEKYLLFIKDFSYLIIEDKDYIVSTTQDKRKQIFSDDFRLFLVNLNLCVYDIQLNESLKYASDLEHLKSYINNGGYLDEQKKKMFKKANFLLFKWQKRAEINKNIITSVIDGEEKDNYESEVVGYGDEWEEIVEYINNHYIDESDRKIRNSFQKIKNKEIEDYSCRDIHLSIKYYKDIQKGINKLDNLIEYIESKKESNDTFSVIYRYAINNRFSLFLENCNDKNIAFNEYIKINKNDRNYFPQYKFLKKSIRLIKNVITKQNNTLEELEEIESFISNILEPEFNQYKANMLWSSQHHNFIYKVDYNECFIDNIFIYSSFVLPAPSKDANDKYEIINSEFQTLKTQIEPLKKINVLLFDIRKNKIQVVELMGIFLAVIAFVMSSISGFEFVKDIWTALLFMIIFGTCLISFLLVLIMITRHNENVFKNRKWKLWVFYLAMLGITVFCSIMMNKGDTNRNQVLDSNVQQETPYQNTIIQETKSDTIMENQKIKENSKK